MSKQRRDIENQLKALPESFKAGEIQNMYDKLVKDVDRLKAQGLSVVKIEEKLHKDHKIIAFSYPTVFFRTVRGEMDPHIFKSLMCLKERVDSGEITDERAKELVIDGAKRQVNGEFPRLAREKKEGGTVQEINMKCRVEDGLTEIKPDV